jgi:hypothetical protein
MRSAKSPGDLALSLIQSEYPNYHPLISLARLAHRADVTANPELELRVHATLLPYVQPKLSNTEVQVDIVEERRVVISLFEDAVEVNKDLTQMVPLVIEDAREIVMVDDGD